MKFKVEPRAVAGLLEAGVAGAKQSAPKSDSSKTSQSERVKDALGDPLRGALEKKDKDTQGGDGN